MEKRLFTSECVTNGHPDKVADSISDAILDACLAQDPGSRVACETMVTTNFCLICGEITTKATVDYKEVAREAIRKIGYVYPGDGFDADNLACLVVLNGDLGLAVGAQQVVGVDALGQTVGQGTGQSHGQGHQLGSLGAGTAEHHALIACAANFVVGAQRDISGLGVDAALDLHGVGVEAVAGVDVADVADRLTGNSSVVHFSLGGDLTADQAEVGGDHGLAGNTGTGVLCQTCVQDSVRNGVGDLVGMAVGNTFRSKESLFHNNVLSIKSQ